MGTKDGAATVPASESAGASTQDAQQPAERMITEGQLTKILEGKTSQSHRAIEKAKEQATAAALEAVAEKFGVDVTELDDVAERIKAASSEDAEAKRLARQVKRLIGENETLQQQLAKIAQASRDATIRAEVSRVGQQHSCCDTELLELALRDRLDVADGRVFVKGPDGEADSGVSLDALVKQTLKAKPHLLSAAPSAGGGSRPSNGQAAAGTPDLLTKEGRFEAWQKLQRQSR